MSATIKPYQAYKDSGVEWLGEVPEHWEVSRIKRATKLNPSKSEVSKAQRVGNAVFLPMQSVGDNGSLDTSDERPISDLWNGFTYFRRGDIIVAKITPCFENGKGACLVNLPTEIGFGSTEFHVLRPVSGIDAYYLYRITMLSDFRKLGADYMTGAAGQQRVPIDFIKNFYVPLPPLPEQTAIARFLDYTDRRIRRYIRAKQKLIKLLEEYKQALIHQAVTGQIDVRSEQPYPTYKDSGVEWLGEVPEHWEIRRLKTIVNHINNPTNTKDDEDLYIALENVESWTGRLLEQSIDMQFDSQVKRFKSGDVLFGKLRPYLAKVVLTKQRGVCVGEFLVLRAKSFIVHHYLELTLRSARAIDHINSSTYGAKMPRADWSFIGAMLFPLPPLPEQTAIVEYLDAKTAKFDAAIAAARREIELMREYRERLTVDVVTGKLDVREAAANLPEESSAEMESIEEELNPEEEPSEEKPSDTELEVTEAEEEAAL